jgi:PII-like signaling protein
MNKEPHMQGIYLKFYVAESQKHGSLPVHEWLLESAKQLGIHGGSTFRAMAGFGRHGRLHQDHFFELAGTLPIEVDLMVTNEEAKSLLALIEAEGLSLFYAKLPAEFGITRPSV